MNDPRDIDEMLSDHGDLEGVLGELLGDSEELPAGIYGTCDWGGCNKPANLLRFGLPVCDECYAMRVDNDADQ